MNPLSERNYIAGYACPILGCDFRCREARIFLNHVVDAAVDGCALHARLERKADKFCGRAYEIIDTRAARMLAVDQNRPTGNTTEYPKVQP